MDDAARMGIGDGLADGVEAAKEFAEDERIGGGVVVGDDGVERAAFDEAHDVVGLSVVIAAETVDRDDGGVFELAGDLGFVEEAFLEREVVGVLGEDLLEGDFAVDVFVTRQVDQAQAAAGVLAEDGERHGEGGERCAVRFGEGRGAGGGAAGNGGGAGVGVAGAGVAKRWRAGGEVHGVGDFAGMRGAWALGQGDQSCFQRCRSRRFARGQWELNPASRGGVGGRTGGRPAARN